MELGNQAAVITEAASGIGEAIARRFAARGMRVLIADLSEERGGTAAQTLGETATFIRADVRCTIQR